MILVRTGDSSWRKHITIHFESNPAGTELSGWASEAFLARGAVLLAEAAATSVGRLTAIDGAVIINRDLELFGFGAVLDSPADPTEIPVVVTPTGQAMWSGVGIQGGTRHQSTAAFCFENPGAVAFVASHDGPLTIFCRAPGTNVLSVFRNANYYID